GWVVGGVPAVTLEPECRVEALPDADVADAGGGVSCDVISADLGINSAVVRNAADVGRCLSGVDTDCFQSGVRDGADRVVGDDGIDDAVAVAARDDDAEVGYARDAVAVDLHTGGVRAHAVATSVAVDADARS